MLITLLVAAALSAPVHRTQAVHPKTTLHFTVEIPPVPIASSLETLHITRSRKLIPLTATLTLEDPADEENDLVAAINRERELRGLGMLTPDPVLCKAATQHSREMCDLNYFAHQSPTPGEATPVDRYVAELRAHGQDRPDAALVGENIFYASLTNETYNVQYAHQSLMASPGHRRNILEPRFTKVGVGLYRDPEGRFWVTEMFLRDS